MHEIKDYMKYLEFNFQLTAEPNNICTPDIASDVLSAQLAEIGFEAFEQTENSLKAYIQIPKYDQDGLQAVLDFFPLEGWRIEYDQQEAEYANWNEQWEKEGFQPIIIGDQLCVHGTQHTFEEGDTKGVIPQTRYELIVSPRLAFGSGTHPTTRQLLEVLLQTDVKGFHVIDAGCGTGILGLLCKMRGAQTVSSYDIDEWSVENTKENARLNQLTLDAWEGDASVLSEVMLKNGKANLLIANINRNILLADMPTFAEALKPAEGQLLLSGFYEDDIPYLIDKANTLNLKETFRLVRDGWVVLMFHN